jgi:hypothetical protein
VISGTWRGTTDARTPGVLSSIETPSPRSFDLVKTFERLILDHGAAFRSQARFRPGAEYQRERVYVTPDFEVWLLSWMPGQITTIHDHGGGLTIASVLAGVVLEERFVPVGQKVRPAWTMVRTTGDTDVIDGSAIHRVSPLGTAVTLHLCAPVCREGQTYQVVS